MMTLKKFATGFRGKTTFDELDESKTIVINTTIEPHPQSARAALAACFPRASAQTQQQSAPQPE